MSFNTPGIPLRALFLFLLLCNGLSLRASTEQAASPVLNFKVFMANEGLPAAQVRKIFQDSRGFLWLATTNGGLLRYEGRRFTLFRHDPVDSHSISGNTIWDIAEDSSGNLYFATVGGLSRWDRQLERFDEIQLLHPPGQPAAAKDTRRLQFDASGTLWIGTYNAGIQLLHPGATVPVAHPSLPHLSVQSFCFDSHGELWIGTWSEGLFRYNFQSGHLSRYEVHAPAGRQLPDNSVRDVVEDPLGRIWIATLAGLCRITASRDAMDLYLADAEAQGVLGAVTIDDLYIARDGRLWLGSDGGGLLLYDQQTDRFVAYRHNPFNPRSIATDCVRHVFEDHEGDLWTGHYPTGLSHASRSNAAFSLVRHDPLTEHSLSANIVYCFEEDAHGRLWIGTDRHGLDLWDRRTNTWRHFRHDPDDPETLSVDTIACLYADRRGRIWAGTWNGGLNRLDPETGRVKRYTYDPQLPGTVGYRHIKQVIEDTLGQVWVATDGGGINRYRPETDDFASYRHSVEDAGSLNSDVVLCLALLRSGRLLAGTQRGLAVYSPADDVWHPLVVAGDETHPLNHSPVNDLTEARDGALWVSTADAGLYRINVQNTECRRYGTANGLPSDSIRAALEDGAGQIWGSSINGLFRLEPASGRCWNYGTDNGLQGPLFNRRARLKLRSGELLFGGIEGFNLIQPALVSDSAPSPHIVITRLEVFNQLVRPGLKDSPLPKSITECSSIALPHNLSVFSLEFSSLRFHSTPRMQYQYRLLGLDPSWVQAGAEQRATYTNLDPGLYQFEVRSKASDGSWDERGVRLAIEIEPAFHQTLWFRGLVVLLLLGSGIALSRMVLQRRILARMHRLEQERKLALERQSAAEQKAQLEHQLAQVQRMDSIGRLAGGVAHDLNNMIQPILGFSELALLDVEEDSPVRENIWEITRAAERSRDLVRQLLAFARKQTLEMRILDLNTVITGFHAILRRTLREDVRLELKLAESLPSMRGDSGQLEQILLNLAVNAQDAMPSGGRIFIQTEVCTLESGVIGAEEEFKPGHYLQLSFSDTGCGIPKSVLPRILEPFFTTKERGKGTGLGLATVYGIARQHGGHLKIYSEEGKGTTMRLYFPVCEHTAPTLVRENTAAVGQGGTETLLVVEDESQVRALTSSALRRAGFTVLLAASSTEALTVAEKHDGPINLLLSDIILPDFNGKELHNRLLEIRPGLRALFMSGYSADVISHHGVLHEDLHFIQKPFNIALLLLKVREALDDGEGAGRRSE